MTCKCRQKGDKMKYIIYKITNLVNGYIYIGQHGTNNINDDYMGSGRALKRAFKENFLMPVKMVAIPGLTITAIIIITLKLCGYA